jgi:hypothetical protein
VEATIRHGHATLLSLATDRRPGRYRRRTQGRNGLPRREVVPASGCQAVDVAGDAHVCHLRNNAAKITISVALVNHFRMWKFAPQRNSAELQPVVGVYI